MCQPPTTLPAQISFSLFVEFILSPRILWNSYVCLWNSFSIFVEFIQSICPDLFILLGPLPTSKTLRSWIEQTGAERVVVEPSGRKVDPLDGPSRALTMKYDQLSMLQLEAPDPAWLDVWTQAERAVECKLQTELARLPISVEPKIVRILSEHLPANSLFYCANSMPIRELEWFWKPGNLGRRLFGARGVNGIDGTLGKIGRAHV